MNNTNEILERILLNMKYDSKKTLNENKSDLEKHLILEEQQIPTTMNQIMQFQNWVWKNVDKLGDPEKADKKKLYNTKLCDKPCTVYGKQVYNKDSGHYHRKGGAIDGFYGGNTKKLWGQYKSSYIKANPEWNQADVKVREKLLGKTYPTTSQEIKNFQRYYLEEIENYDKESANPESKIETKLCDKPCLYGEAVDGVLGDNTKKIWNTHGEGYKKENKKWSISIPWDKKTQDDQEILKARVDLAPLLRFSISNPSGWDFITELPEAIPAYYLSKIAHKNSASCPFYWGWDINNKVFPYPKEYSQEIIDKVKFATQKETEKENKVREEVGKELSKIQQEKAEHEEKERKNLDWHRGMSDRLGPNYVYDESGLTKGQLDYKMKNDAWKAREAPLYARINNSVNKILASVTQWNTDLPKVKAAIPIRCKRPMKFCDTQDHSNCAYMSYSDVCKNAGGLWVWGVGTNGETCGCRDMTDPAFNQPSHNGYMTQIMGSKGKKFTTIFYLDKAMAWQTPGTGGLDIKAKADTHTNMMWAELGLLALGFIASASGVGAPLAPLFFAASAAVGVADGVMYIQEGDTHMGVMMIGLSMLGAGEVGALIKGVKAEGKAYKFIKTYGEDGFKTFMTKALRNPELLTSSEKILFNELKAASLATQRVMGIEIRKKIAKTFIEQLPKQSAKWSFKDISKLFVKLTTQQPSLKGIVIYIAGVPYTIDQVYLALYGNDNDRQRSSIGMIYNWLYDKDYAPNVSGVKTGTFKDGKYTNPQINKEKEKYLKDQFLIKLQQELQQEAQLGDIVQQLVGSLGDVVSADKIMTDNQLAQWMKKNTSKNNPKGFDQAKYDELLKKQQEEQQKEQKRIKNLEGCNLLDSIKTLSTGDSAVYKEYKDKIQFLKDKIKSNKKEDFINGKCNDVEFFWKRIDTKPGDKDFDFAKQVQRDTRTIVNNPNSQTNESYNIRLNKIIKENLKKYIR